MAKITQFTRPPFSEAMKEWKAALAARGFPDDVVWIFDENLCWEGDSAAQASLKLGYQTRFRPPPPEAEQIAYDYFCEFELRLVFYRIGTSHGKSICLLLCDEWFESKGESDGYLRRDDWLISFRPGSSGEIEEIADQSRWERRVIRDRPLHDLDFCMTLRAVHEILAHGRVLTAYEHYALKVMNAWRRLLKPAGE